MTEETLMDYIGKYCEENVDLLSYVGMVKRILEWFEEQVRELMINAIVEGRKGKGNVSASIITWLKEKIPLEEDQMSGRGLKQKIDSFDGVLNFTQEFLHRKGVTDGGTIETMKMLLEDLFNLIPMED